jgi:hypothetical protein
MKKLSLLLVLLMNAEFGFSQSIRFSGGTSLYLPLNINNLKITQAPGAGFQLGSEIKFKYIGFETRAELFRSQIIVDDDPLVSSLNLYSHSINYYEFNLPISFKFYSPTIYERYSFNVCFGHIFRRLAWSNATLTPIFNTGGPIISGKPDFRIFNNSLLDNFFIGIGSEYQFKSKKAINLQLNYRMFNAPYGYFGFNTTTLIKDYLISNKVVQIMLNFII